LFDPHQVILPKWRYPRTMFEVVIRNLSPIKWEWQLRDHDGNVLSRGLEKSRAAAKYQGERALFQHLLIRPNLRSA
jgi:hypothetical protein